MSAVKSNSFAGFLINTLIVFIVFMLIDYLFYGLICPQQGRYTNDLGELLTYTALFSAAFAHLYNKASVIWAPGNKSAFVYKNYVTAPDDYPKATWPKIANSLVFSVLFTLAVLMIFGVCASFLQVLLIDILQALRGEYPLPPRDIGSHAIKIIGAAIALELTGKTESDPIRP